MTVVLLVAAPAQAKDPLQRYAEGTWASFVAMTESTPGCPPTS